MRDRRPPPRAPRAASVVGRDDAAVDAERRRDQRVAEQQALDLGERQHADDLAVALGEQVMGAVAEGALQHVLPVGEVEEGAVGVRTRRRRSRRRGRLRANGGRTQRRSDLRLPTGRLAAAGALLKRRRLHPCVPSRKSVEQALEARVHRVEVQVMAEPRLERRALHARLRRDRPPTGGSRTGRAAGPAR